MLCVLASATADDGERPAGELRRQSLSTQSSDVPNVRSKTWRSEISILGGVNRGRSTTAPTRRKDMKKRTYITATLAAMAATGLVIPANIASAAGGDGASICSYSEGDQNIGVLVVELQQMLGYDGDKNPGNRTPFLPRYAQLCNPHYGH
jgi:hypothetical protein